MSGIDELCRSVRASVAGLTPGDHAERESISAFLTEFDRLTGLGVTFTQPPTNMGPVTTAVLDDTCGNLIQLASAPAA